MMFYYFLHLLRFSCAVYILLMILLILLYALFFSYLTNLKSTIPEVMFYDYNLIYCLAAVS
jgi:hypothetical protein